LFQQGIRIWTYKKKNETNKSVASELDLTHIKTRLGSLFILWHLPIRNSDSVLGISLSYIAEHLHSVKRDRIAMIKQALFKSNFVEKVSSKPSPL
jgi:hypothetical protein